AIADILQRKKRVIICGGTGLYIDAVICNTLFPAVKPNAKLRSALAKESLESLQKKLQSLDARRLALVDKHNKVRLIRAIEIATALGSVPPLKRVAQYDIEWHYLDFPDEVLKQRIHDRLIKRMESGMVEEVERLHKKGLS